MQVYKKTYSWAHNTNDANWAAYITIARAPEHRHSEEDMERGVGNASVSGRPVMLCSNVLPANESWRAPDVTHLQLLDVMLMMYWSSSDKLGNSSPRHEKRVDHTHLLLSHAWCNVRSMQEAQPVPGMTVHPAVTWEQKRRQHAAAYVTGPTPVSCALLVECSATVGSCAMQEEQPLLETTVSPAETREHKRLRAKMNLAMWSSLVANVLLLVAKIVAYVLSHSSSILASAADSFVDIASQVRRSCTCAATWRFQDCERCREFRCAVTAQ